MLHNVPRIRDVEAMLELLADLGVRVDWRAENTVSLQADQVRGTDVSAPLAERIRASFLAAGPLLGRFGSALMPPPGGDVIGRRRLDPHLDAFRALGATVEHGRDIRITANGGLKACDFLMDEPSVMGTENALMAAALIDGTTVIRNAASEPHVQDVARMLNKMGAAIEGIGSNVMQVHGMGSLGGCEHTVTPDHIEIASFMALAGVTGGELRIEGCVPDDMRMIRSSSGGSACARSSTARTSSSRAARSSWSSATPATTSPRSRTARGRPSRPTSRASRSRSPPSPAARC